MNKSLDMIGVDKRLDKEYNKKRDQINKLKIMVKALRISDEYDFVVPESEYFTEEMREFENLSGTDMWTRIVYFIEGI